MFVYVARVWLDNPLNHLYYMFIYLCGIVLSVCCHMNFNYASARTLAIIIYSRFQVREKKKKNSKERERALLYSL